MSHKWSLSDDGRGRVLISKGPLTDDIHPTEVFSHKRVKFYLLYDSNEKMKGYTLEYDPKSHYRFSTFNSFGVVYYPDDDDRVPKMEVLFEDSTIRLLEYENYRKIRDYFLIGRWRTDVSLGIPEET